MVEDFKKRDTALSRAGLGALSKSSAALYFMWDTHLARHSPLSTQTFCMMRCPPCIPRMSNARLICMSSRSRRVS